MSRSSSRLLDLPPPQPLRAPLRLRTTTTTTNSEANRLHRKIDERRPSCTPLHEKKQSCRMADLETKLSKAEEEIKKLRDQLESAVFKIDMKRALESSAIPVKQSIPVTPTPEPDQEALPLSPQLENICPPTAIDEGEESTEAMSDDCHNNTEQVDSHESRETVELQGMITEKEKEIEILLEENMIFKRRAEEEAERVAATARAKEEDMKARVSLMEQEVEESRARTEQLTRQLEVAELAKERLEAEVKRLRVQTEQWRKAAEAAVTALATADRGAEIGRGYAGWRSPFANVGEGAAGARPRAAAGIRVIGDLWKRKAQQQQ